MPFKQKPMILIVDDDEQIRNLVSALLSPDHDCTVAGSVDEAMEAMRSTRFDLVLSDIGLGRRSGLDLVPLILNQAPETVVIMISGQQSIESAIEAMRVGAFDYITKPLELRHVEAVVQRGLRHHQLLQEKQQYENHLEELVEERAAQVEHLAYYDRLTDLPNRFLFLDRLAQAVNIAQRDEHMVGLLMISLDRLSQITDTLGHEAKDRIVAEAAIRLNQCIDEGDTLARLDGDEFGVILPLLSQTGTATQTAASIIAAFKQPFHANHQDLYVTSSIGLSLFPANGDDSIAMLKNAGAALGRARSQGGNNYQFYAAEMNAMAVKRLAMEARLRRAVENDQFVVHYQPVLDLATGEIVAVEALVRLQDPKLGILAPSHFIDLAEETGLIIDIGELVLRRACRQMRGWEARGYGRLRVAVNISARHFQQSNFLESVFAILSETGLQPHRLELELTETSIMHDPEAATVVLAKLRERGVRVSIDDFGTGYSSLSYLKQLPIDTVKLDQSFVGGATTDPNDAALVMAVITLAHQLHLRVIAEGVETEEQATFLRLLRCNEAQGYLFGKPMPAEQLEFSLKANQKRDQAFELRDEAVNFMASARPRQGKE